MFYQVKKLLFQQNLSRQLFRHIFNQGSVKALYPLESRSLLKVSGKDASVFLQGLITNDMQHFEEGASSMYAMFLNNKGRVLYDILVHKWEGSDSFLLECDKSIIKSLHKHLNAYKLRRNIAIGDMTNLKVYALITPNETTDMNTSISATENVSVYRDPHIADLGHRVLVTTKVEDLHLELKQNFGDNIVIASDDQGYKYLKYKLGVSEGAEDLPPGVHFPLEANCDYLHGVSFHKGCYIGQELTARVHHTGVVRKRLMPIRLTEIPNEEIPKDSTIIADNNPKSNVGKCKCLMNDCGLGLVRIKEALDAKVLKIKDYIIEVEKPSWWPIEAPKEKITAKAESE